jgi:hypothetical protein
MMVAAICGTSNILNIIAAGVTAAVLLPFCLQESLTQPFRLGVGLGVSSSNSDEPFVAATATKKISLLEGEHTQLTAKARMEMDPRSGKVCTAAQQHIVGLSAEAESRCLCKSHVQ